ncbi:MAG: hypothetical protein Q7T89_04125 [Anaerolineales bacterium]|nr:hypothetical protein [Anaerolineales bacterium]
MKQTTYLLLVTSVFVVLFASACGGSAAPATQAVPPPVEVVPTQAPAEVVEPAQQPAATAQTFAPACQAAASCAAPEVKDTVANETYCVEKIPYQNINVMPGTTFESLDPTGELKCQDSGTVVNGKNVITCTGKQLWTYELKFTNSACAANALATGTGQCQDGLGYDAAQNCCAPLAATDAGSVTIKVNMGACPTPK